MLVFGFGRRGGQRLAFKVSTPLASRLFGWTGEGELAGAAAGGSVGGGARGRSGDLGDKLMFAESRD